MKTTRVRFLRLALATSLALSAVGAAHAQLAYGVDAGGNLFNFSLSAPSSVTSIGNLGFVPEGIDFRSGTSTLYAIDIGASLSRLYTVDRFTGTATAIGAGFATAGTAGGLNYDLSTATSFGFDFNPTTQQPDGSIRIRLTANNGTNLRLHSGTGGIAAVDGMLGNLVGAVAYINNESATIGGTTALYDVDYQNDTLLLQNPPNAGTLSVIGALGVNVGPNIGFDIYTKGGDATIAGDSAFLVNSTAAGAATLYSVNLATGAATQLALINRDFTGGFAVTAPVPEPATYGVFGAAALLGAVTVLRRKRPSVAPRQN